MTTFLLIRHGQTATTGITVTGWQPGQHLDETGRNQALRLAERLATVDLQAIYTSPLERTIETAEPTARAHSLSLQLRSELGELRIGDWEGMAIRDLDRREDWRRFNTFRSTARPPGGELMTEVQTRMIDQLERLREDHPNHCVAVVSHGDPIRATIAHFLGIPLDLALRMEIGTAGVSVVQLADWGPRVLCINNTGEIPACLQN